MIIENLLSWPKRRSLASAPEMDALLEAGTMLETALVDVKFDAITSSLWMLFDCRGAIQLEVGDTAVVVVRGVTRYRWDAVFQTGRVWRAVMRWRPTVSAGVFSCDVDIEPDSELRVDGSDAEFYVGNAFDEDERPPDFMDATDEEIRAGIARWNSEFEVISASFTDLDSKGGTVVLTRQ